MSWVHAPLADSLLHLQDCRRHGGLLLRHEVLHVEPKRPRQVHANEARGVNAHHGVQPLVVLNNVGGVIPEVKGVAQRPAVQGEEDLFSDPVDAAPDRVAAPVALAVPPEHASRAVEQAGVITVVAPVDVEKVG
jgi:hypothetical protein